MLMLMGMIRCCRQLRHKDAALGPVDLWCVLYAHLRS